MLVDETESRFLEMLEREPEDDVTRLVYADWLEAAGERERAEFLRTVAKRAAPSVNRKKVPLLEERLVRLSTTSDARWRALVSRPAIDGCPELAFKCPLKWSALTATSDAKVRHCGSCDRDVHFCATLEEVREHAWSKDCVAFDPALRRGEAVSTYQREHPDHWDLVEMGEVA
jgi:uncharacterized protein (TIGR02996 family)